MMPPSKNIRILVVEDDEDDFFILSEYIRHIPGMTATIKWHSKYEDALNDMINGRHDLYFVDYRLGAKSGVALLKEALDHNCQEPIILLTGKGNYNVDLQAMQLGAVDYLVKTELNYEKVERCIRYSMERTSVMKALSANEKKYRAIYEKSKDLIFITDEALNFVDVNPAVQSMLGYTREECCNMNLSDLIDQAQHKKFLVQAFRSGKEIKDWEVLMVASNGERKNCIITASKEINQDNVTYIQGIIHDITSIKKIEKATLQAEKLAMAGRLVHTLAHEVRNPLNNITLSLEQMMEDVTDEHVVSYLNIISRNSTRINHLIRQLLNSSQPIEIQMQREMIQNIIDNVITAALDRLTLKRIALQISYPQEGNFEIMADKEKLSLALLNIVINAVEAMEETKGCLSIRVEPADENIVVRISDNGVGISPENISRLFEPYFTQKRNGVGLGLAFTLNILQAHKASIEASSVEGEGTTFTITFPPYSEASESAIIGQN